MPVEPIGLANPAGTDRLWCLNLLNILLSSAGTAAGGLNRLRECVFLVGLVSLTVMNGLLHLLLLLGNVSSHFSGPTIQLYTCPRRRLHMAAALPAAAATMEIAPTALEPTTEIRAMKKGSVAAGAATAASDG